MPGTNAGTGQPISFQCSAGRKEKTFRNDYRGWRKHDVVRTGRERKSRVSSHQRMDTVDREYVCSCGHRGWSAHYELALYYPVDGTLVPTKEG